MQAVNYVVWVLLYLPSCFGAVPVFTSPAQDGSRTVSLSEDAAVESSVLLIAFTPTTASVSLAATESPGGAASSAFSLTGLTIRTTDDLDFESVTAYTITLEAADGADTGTATFVVQVSNVMDEVPSLPASSPNVFDVAWDEEQAAGSTVFHSFSVNDADVGDSHTFSLIGGDMSFFAINPGTGEISVTQTLDRDAAGAQTSFTLQLQVEDSAGNTLATAQTLTITLSDINDNAPVCQPAYYSNTLPEASASGITVATLACSDLDSSPNGDISSYVIVSGDDLAAKFVMNGAALETTSNQLDYEGQQTYTLLVDVIDNGAAKLTGTATVLVYVSGVNEFDPVWGTFTPPGVTHSLQESVQVGTTVLTLSASDQDAGPEGHVTYTLDTVTGVFSLDATTGTLVTTSLLDADNGVTSYTLKVVATDGGSPARTAEKTLTVNIGDENDNAPVFSPASYTATIDESDARSKSWAGLQLTATDGDRDTGTLTYQITGGDPNAKFKFTASGQLKLKTAIDVDRPAAEDYYYVMTVQASDEGVPNSPALTGSASVTILISPSTNDYRPDIGSPFPSDSEVILESTAVGTSVMTIPASDKDMEAGVNQSVTFSITDGNVNNAFTMDSSLGVLRTASVLDYETTRSYILEVTASDSGGKSRSVSVTVSLQDVNEQAPSCDAYNMAASVEEAQAAVTVTTVSCTGGDTGDTVSYSVVPPVAEFTVEPASGVVSTLTALDYETQTSYTLQIEVKDSLSPVMTSTVTLTIVVEPVNEFAPEFVSSTYTALISEGAAAGTSVVTRTATDADDGSLDGTVRYSIVSGNGLGAFTVHSSTGLVSTTGTGLDRESDPTITLTVLARDDVPGSTTERSSSATVVVTITDVNDNAPLCQPSSYKVSVTEPSVAGAVLTQLTAVDDDEAGSVNAALTFTITAGDAPSPGHYFTMKGAQLVLVQSVDYEAQTDFTLSVTVRDGGTPSLSSTCDVHVIIISANEHPPQITDPNHSLTLSETTAIGTVIYDVTATDDDVGNGSAVTYAITAGNTDSDFFCYYTSGSVVVWNGLDYDTPPRDYNLTVTASDGALSDSMWLHVSLEDVNDETPVCRKNIYSVTVQENVANGTQVETVKALDADSGVAGIVTFTAVSGNGMTLFAIHPGTGVVTTISNIDREVRRSYSLVVQVADGGTPSLSSSCLLDITVADLNDNAPLFSPVDFTVLVSETDIQGTWVTEVTAADADSSASNNVFSYVLTDNFFQVNATGAVKTKAVLDRELNSQHVLHVLAPDSGAPVLTGTATITVIVTDVNDNTPVISGAYTPTVAEDAAPGTMVTSVLATDADSGDNARLTYAIASGNTNNDFVISAISGVIQVRNSLDRETEAQYRLIVEVGDNGSPRLTATTTVTITISDVNDNTPAWDAASYVFSIAENAPASSTVGQVKATDADEGINAALTYSMVLFWTGSAAHFDLDSASGVMSTSRPLDRESTALYKALLRVSDGGSPQLFSDVNVTIAVTDMNDNAPTFNLASYNVTTTENDAVGTGVLTVTVTDDDINVNSDITLSIDTSTTEGARADLFFQVDSGSGVVSVKQNIDRETDSTFTFNLTASDGGSPSLTSTALVTVSVNDVNDNAPVFSQTYFNTELAYAGQCSSSVATVTASDADSALNGQFTFHLTSTASSPSSSTSSLFQLDAASGAVSLASSLQPGLMYSLNVTARDKGSPTLTSPLPAQVRVDAMTPSDVAVTFELGITQAAILAQRASFLSQVQSLMRASYPRAVARLWCVQANSQGLAKAHVYFLQDDSTEQVSGINAAKYFISQSSARAVFTDRADGVPNSALSGSEWEPFDIQHVLPYEESQTAFLETAAGISLTVVSSLLALGLVAAAVYMLARYCRQANTRKSPVRKRLVEEPRPARNNVSPLPRIVDKPRPLGGGEDFFWGSSSKPV